jgi:hypothetical protein
MFSSLWLPRAASARACAPVDLARYAGPAYVTIAMLALYYVFLLFQTYSKLYLLSKRTPPVAGRALGLRTALGLQPYRYHDPVAAALKYGNTLDPLAILGDRMVGNTLEQLVPFLCSLWLYSLFVEEGPERAWLTGSVYICSRLLYPALFWAGSPWILLSTVPGYAVIWYQLGATLYALRAAQHS